MEEKIMNRWIVVLGALMVQICLGALYIWSVFKVPLMQHFQWEALAVNKAFAINAMMGATVGLVAGRIQDKIGPRWVTTAGGILMALGMILTSRINTIPQLYISFGLICGLGLGFGYIAPLATCVKWFPDKKGLISGLAIAGFGLGAVIFGPLATYFKGVLGLMPTFAYLGIIYGVFIVGGAQLLRLPPPGYKPLGWEPLLTTSSGTGENDFKTSEILKTPQFYLLCISFFFGAAAGMMIIANAVPIATLQGLTGALATSAVIILSLFNAAGRIIWGAASDRLGRTTVLKILFLVCGVTMLSLKMLSGPGILIGIGLVGFCFGGFLTTYPAITADYFGTKYYGSNYSILFFCYGLGALSGPILYDWIKNPIPGQLSAVPMAVSGIACLVGMVLVFLLKPPAEKNEVRL
jgi:OFA family oxalate/formate antiporter-like MFS transporter